MAAKTSAPTALVPPLVLRMRPVIALDDAQLLEFCRQNRELHIERTAEGDLEIMPPTGGETSSRNAGLVAQVWAWTLQDGSGAAFDSNGGFVLPNRAMRTQA